MAMIANTEARITRELLKVISKVREKITMLTNSTVGTMNNSRCTMSLRMTMRSPPVGWAEGRTVPPPAPRHAGIRRYFSIQVPRSTRPMPLPALGRKPFTYGW
jgi:hypothetical protein